MVTYKDLEVTPSQLPDVLQKHLDLGNEIRGIDTYDFLVEQVDAIGAPWLRYRVQGEAKNELLQQSLYSRISEFKKGYTPMQEAQGQATPSPTPTPVAAANQTAAAQTVEQYEQVRQPASSSGSKTGMIIIIAAAAVAAYFALKRR